MYQTCLLVFISIFGFLLSLVVALTEYPGKRNFRNEGFILAQSPRYSISSQRSQDSGSLEKQVRPSVAQLLFSVQLRIPHGEWYHPQWGSLPISMNRMNTIPQRQSQKLISQAVLDMVK